MQSFYHLYGKYWDHPMSTLFFFLLPLQRTCLVSSSLHDDVWETEKRTKDQISHLMVLFYQVVCCELAQHWSIPWVYMYSFFIHINTSIYMYMSMGMYVCVSGDWGCIWPAPVLFWFIRLVESIITESLHLLSFITPHLFSFYSQGLAEYITDFPWGCRASSSTTGDNGMTGRGFWACFIIRAISNIFTLNHYHCFLIILDIRTRRIGQAHRTAQASRLGRIKISIWIQDCIPTLNISL